MTTLAVADMDPFWNRQLPSRRQFDWGLERDRLLEIVEANPHQLLIVDTPQRSCLASYPFKHSEAGALVVIASHRHEVRNHVCWRRNAI